MRLINKWAYACAKGLAEVLSENHQKKAAYYYGFQIIIGGAVNAIVFLAVSLLLGILMPSLILISSFLALRLFAGGYHMNTHGKCLLVSLVLFVIAAITVKYTYTYWQTAHMMVLIAVTFTAGLYVLIKYAPKDTPNKPVTDPDKIRKFKALSVICLFFWLLGISILAVFKYKMYVLSLSFGVLMELFAVTPTGHKFFDVINYGFRATLKRKKMTA